MQQIFQNGRRRLRRKAIPKTASEALLAVKNYNSTSEKSQIPQKDYKDPEELTVRLLT